MKRIFARRGRLFAGFVGVVACAATVTGRAQAVDVDFAFGRDYLFERVFVSREVHDRYDDGKIDLSVWVYRPVRNDRHQVVLYSHGSTGGQAVSPKEPWVSELAPMEYFVKRGYTYVVVSRRGVGESQGTYLEEVPYYPGKGTVEENTDLAPAALESAVADTSAVIDHLVLGKLSPVGAKIIFIGVSRGGFLSLVMGARRPEITAGVVNFVGGWLSINDAWPPVLNARRLKWTQDQLTEAGKTIKIPTLWLYGAADSAYTETTTRSFFASFTANGAKAEYHLVGKGHGIAAHPEVWSAILNRYMSELENR
jgi:pimeloyl-ACP methyl ester carboxylesterase